MAAARSALAKAPHDSFGYGDPCGRPELRAALAEYLARARGVRASPDTIVVCSGFTQGLALLGRALSQSGARAIGVEAYGHRRHREVLTDAGLQLVSMPVDDQGAQPSGLDADAALLTPAHQFPLGMALSAERRSRFVDWAAKRDTYVIEDDYDGEFRYDRRPVGAMQALAPGHVIYAGTASKTLAPGLRLAWLVVPESLLPAVLDGHALIGAQPSVPDQLTLAEFIASGRYDRHIRRSRLAYQRRRDRLIAALARDVPSVTVRGMAAGMHAVLDLAEECDEREVVERAGRRDLAIDPLSEYTAEAHPPALVIGYATPPAHAFTSAVARLIATLADTSE
jgi:GntR family transcriptional regulator/MocR family aminotransferase